MGRLGKREWGEGTGLSSWEAQWQAGAHSAWGKPWVTVAGGGGLGTEWKEKRWSSWSEVILLGLSGPCFNLQITDFQTTACFLPRKTLRGGLTYIPERYKGTVVRARVGPEPCLLSVASICCLPTATLAVQTGIPCHKDYSNNLLFQSCPFSHLLSTWHQTASWKACLSLPFSCLNPCSCSQLPTGINLNSPGPPTASLSILAKFFPSHLHSGLHPSYTKSLQFCLVQFMVILLPLPGMASIPTPAVLPLPNFRPQLKDYPHHKDFPNVLCPQVHLAILFFISTCTPRCKPYYCSFVWGQIQETIRNLNQ